MIFPTPTERGRPLIRSEFETLTDGLDYAATCQTGLNYYAARGGITCAMPYAELREKSIDVAKRLVPFADKNARIGRNVLINSDKNRPDSEHPNWVSRDGIVIVPKNAVIEDGTII